MMSAKQFVTRLAWVNLPILMLVCGLNYWIDVGSIHHLPEKMSLFPRTQGHSALSKLHYVSTEKIDTVFFGTSRVEVGLPPNSDLVGQRRVYNAGLSGVSMGQWAPFAQHSLALTEPRQIVVGLEFNSFCTKPDSEVDLDLSLLSSNYIMYLAKRIPYDLGRSMSFKATENSIRAIMALSRGKTHDGIVEYNLGQLTEASMQKTYDSRDRVEKAFQHYIERSFDKLPEYVADKNAWHMFENLVTNSCQKDIVTRIYIHPTHALMIDSMRQNGTWSRFEQWKTELANLATRYQHQQCDIKIVDFSGYNSITSETIHGILPKASLHYYWEPSHYKSSIGELILKRLFSPMDTGIPPDFGRELRQDTIADVLTAIRVEQSRYLVSHSEDIKLAQQWMPVKTLK